MSMMSFIELQKVSELSFECMFGLLCNVYLLYKKKKITVTPKIELPFSSSRWDTFVGPRVTF